MTWVMREYIAKRLVHHQVSSLTVALPTPCKRRQAKPPNLGQPCFVISPRGHTRTHTHTHLVPW